MHRSRPLDLIVLTVAAWAIVVAPANAYIDAGSVSVIFQTVVAALAAGWFAVKMFVARGLGVFGRRGADDTEEQADEPAAQPADQVTTSQDT